MTRLTMDSPVGRLTISEESNAITEICYGGKKYDEAPTPLLLEAKNQLEEYFAGRRKYFDLPLNPQGTDFQKKVWHAISEIPYGKTCSYKDIAQRIESPKAFRAVGGANNKNPLPIVIPCHRVIGTGGALVGYGGGLSVKVYLLNLEKKNL